MTCSVTFQTFCDQVVGLLEVAGRLLASNTKELQQLQGL